jgi:hypothetical protein
MTTDQTAKYNYYVERLLLLNIPTAEPTEYVTNAPSLVLSPYPDTNSPDVLQYIIAISVATSIFTTCCVICTSYYFAIYRKKIRLQYLRSIASSHSSDTLCFEDIYKTPGESVCQP